jgi:hypothetical protein
MKTMLEINKKKVPAVRIDPSLDKYDSVVLFPEKLAKANVQLKKSGFPKLTNKKTKSQP